MPDDTEQSLLNRAAAGDSEAFRALFEAYREAVFRLAYHLTGSVDAAEDVGQECFLRLVRNPGRFDERRGSLRQYLYGMVRNLVLQRWQSGQRAVPLDAALDAATEADPVSGVEAAGAVRAAVAALPDLQREAIVLFEFEGLSLEEVAAVAGCDAGTVKSRLFRARERLRRTLAAYRNAAAPYGKRSFP